jgi:hypothetical protein
MPYIKASLRLRRKDLRLSTCHQAPDLFIIKIFFIRTDASNQQQKCAATLFAIAMVSDVLQMVT